MILEILLVWMYLAGAFAFWCFIEVLAGEREKDYVTIIPCLILWPITIIVLATIGYGGALVENIKSISRKKKKE